MNLEEQIKSNILDLESKLLNDNPLMPQALAKVHKELSRNPAVIQSLDDEQIKIITASLSKYTRTEIITKAAKKKGPKAKSLKNISIDDL